MENERLLRMILESDTQERDAIEMMFCNYIDIGGARIGLTIENCLKAYELIKQYENMKKEKNESI